MLGAFAVLEADQTDWKIVAVDTSNPASETLNGIRDIETLMPGYLETMLEWFHVYKMPEGKGRNEIGCAGEIKDRELVSLGSL